MTGDEFKNSSKLINSTGHGAFEAWHCKGSLLSASQWGILLPATYSPPYFNNHMVTGVRRLWKNFYSMQNKDKWKWKWRRSVCTNCGVSGREFWTNKWINTTEHHWSLKSAVKNPVDTHTKPSTHTTTTGVPMQRQYPEKPSTSTIALVNNSRKRKKKRSEKE